MNIADDLVRAFNDGYEKGKADAESYLLHCGDTDEPQTNADRIRSMSDEELADWLGVYCNGQTAQEVGEPCVSGMGSCEECWLDWLRQEAKDG